MGRAKQLGQWCRGIVLDPKASWRNMRRPLVARALSKPGGIWDFVVALWSGWTLVIALMVTAFALTSYLWRREDKSPVIDIEPAWWVSLIAVSLLIAAFIAFQRTRKREHQLAEQRKPSLVVSHLQPVTTMTTLFEDEGEYDHYGGVRLFKLLRVGIHNKGGTTVQNAQVHLESITPTEGIPVPVQIGAMLDNKLLRRAPFDVQPEMQFSVYVAARPMIGPEAGTVYLILDHEHLIREIPVSVEHILQIAVFADDVPPRRFQIKLNGDDMEVQLVSSTPVTA